MRGRPLPARVVPLPFVTKGPMPDTSFVPPREGASARRGSFRPPHRRRDRAPCSPSAAWPRSTSCSPPCPPPSGWPPGPRPRPGLSEPDTLAELERLAGANRPADPTWSASPAAAPTTTRCRRSSAGGVPRRVRDRLHALPARGGPGGAAGAVRVPDAWSPGSARPARRQRLALRRGHGHASRRSTWPSPPPAASGRVVGRRQPPHWRRRRHLRRGAPGHALSPMRPLVTGAGHQWPQQGAAAGRCRRPVPQLPGLIEDLAAARAAADAAGALLVVARPGRRRPAQAAGQLRRRRGGGGGPAVRHARCRSAGPTSACSPAARSTSGACPAGWWARPSTSEGTHRLRDHAADPRAGHPPGEGVVQRVHQPDPHRGVLRHPAGLAGHAGLRELALRCARGDPLRPRGAAGRARRDAAGRRARSCASSPFARRCRPRRSSTGWPTRASSPAWPSPVDGRPAAVVRQPGGAILADEHGVAGGVSPRQTNARAEIDGYVGRPREGGRR